jgi:hypothetical protein
MKLADLPPVQRATVFAVLESGARWCQNILTELSGNYARMLPAECREHLKIATTGISEFASSLAKLQADFKKTDDIKL